MGKIVKVFVNGTEKTIINAQVLREGERVVDAATIVFTGDQIINHNDTIEYLQDIVDLTGLKLFLGFEQHVKDESTLKNDGTITGTATFVDGVNGKSGDFGSAKINFITLANESNFDRDTNQTFSILIRNKGSTSATLEAIMSKHSATIGWRLYHSAVDELVFEITDGTNTHTWTYQTDLRDGIEHSINVRNDGTATAGGLTIYVDGVSVTLVTGGIYPAGSILNNASVLIGADNGGTNQMTGQFDNAEFYARELTTIESVRVGTKTPAINIMKFAGKVWKIEKKTFTKEVQCKSLGKEIGEVEMRGEVFENKSPEFIVQSVIDNNTTLTYIDSGLATGIVIEKYVADGKVLDVITDLARLANRIWRADSVANFFFEPFNFRISSIVYTHGTDTGIFDSGEDDTELVNDLIILGENKKYMAEELFSGTGSQTDFVLAEKATSARVTISGVQQAPEIAFEIDTENRKIIFTVAPASGTDNILVEYQFEKPLYIRQTRANSITTNGRRAKRLIMPWIRTYQDGVRFASAYLHVFSVLKKKVNVNILGLEHRLKENDVILLVNSIKGINGSFLVKSLKYDYPSATTILQTGEFSFDEQESKKQVLEKIHDLESALTVVKDIREYESAEELLNLTDAITIEAELTFPEPLALTDVITITTVNKAIYTLAATNYSQDDVYTHEDAP